jgi:hypothetical protein
MCTEKRHDTASESLENLRLPIPLGLKIRLILSNNWTKVRKRSSCCGNYGEPGC